jgi:hypothetical protein
VTFLAKPFAAGELLATLASILAKTDQPATPKLGVGSHNV